MATNHTTNYNLNLWEPSDNFVREEFNENTSRIDAALATKATTAALTAETNARTSADSALAARVTALENKSRYTKLKEHVCSENKTTLYIYMNDIDWTQWDRLYLDVKLTAGGSLFFFDSDDANAENIGHMGCGRAGDHSWSKRLIFNVGYRADRALDVTCGESHLSCSRTYAQLVKVAFIGNNVMGKGAQYILWGEK